MIERILRELNNFFVVSTSGVTRIQKLNDVFVTDASIFIPGQYICIQGSMLNDGVYRIKSIELQTNCLKLVDQIMLDESTLCFVYGLAIPKEVIELAVEIETYVDATENENITSESLGDYSVTYDKNNSWTNLFRKRLIPFKRVYCDLPSTKRKVPNVW